MRFHSSALSVIGAAALLLPSFASAHEHATLQIGSSQYSIVIGMRNEPSVVDAPSGVEFIVSRLGGKTQSAAMEHHDDGDEDEASGAPALGLEKDLSVEVSAGEKTKIFTLQPTYGQPGSYHADFIPTVQTTYTFRLTGKIDGTPVSLSFSCLPSGHAKAEEETEYKMLSEGVMQMARGGGFGCPLGKTEVSFPEPAPPVAQMAAEVAQLQATAATRRSVTIAYLLAAAGLATSLVALRKRRG